MKLTRTGAMIICLLGTVAVCSFQTVSAHQPRLVESENILVEEPEISKAFYGTLTGSSHTYIIDALCPCDLYISVLVPDLSDQAKNISVDVIHDGTFMVRLDAASTTWTYFYEPFGASSYWQGPEFHDPEAPHGTYRIVVHSPDNIGKYSLAIGKVESFDAGELLNTLTLIPQLKQSFFEESPASFIYSPIGAGYIMILFALAFLVLMVARWIMIRSHRADRTIHNSYKNLDTKGRILRLVFAAVLFAWSISTTWNPVLLFISGFLLAEAGIGWCFVHAICRKDL